MTDLNTMVFTFAGSRPQQHTTPGTMDIGLSGRVQTSLDASDFLLIFFESKESAPGRWNRSGDRDRAVDALLDHAQGVHLEASMPQYQKAQKMILADEPWMPLFRPLASDVMPPKIQNLSHHPVWGFVHQD